MSREQILDTVIRDLMLASGLTAEQFKEQMFRRNWQVYRILINQFFLSRSEGFT